MSQPSRDKDVTFDLSRNVYILAEPHALEQDMAHLPPAKPLRFWIPISKEESHFWGKRQQSSMTNPEAGKPTLHYYFYFAYFSSTQGGEITQLGYTERACGDKDDPCLHTHTNMIPAASYSPTRSLMQYHQRWKA